MTSPIPPHLRRAALRADLATAKPDDARRVAAAMLPCLPAEDPGVIAARRHELAVANDVLRGIRARAKARR